MYHCCLCWKSDTVLLIGWADTVKIALVKEKPRGDANTGLPSRYVEIICMYIHFSSQNLQKKEGRQSQNSFHFFFPRFQTDYYISGIAPFNEYLVILAYLEETVNGQRVPVGKDKGKVSVAIRIFPFPLFPFPI